MLCTTLENTMHFNAEIPCYITI